MISEALSNSQILLCNSRAYCDCIVRIYDRLFFSYFFAMCEPRIILIVQGESPLLYYFQERVGCESFIFILHFVLLRKSVSFTLL